jgi:hypothetical protein
MGINSQSHTLEFILFPSNNIAGYISLLSSNVAFPIKGNLCIWAQRSRYNFVLKIYQQLIFLIVSLFACLRPRLVSCPRSCPAGVDGDSPRPGIGTRAAAAAPWPDATAHDCNQGDSSQVLYNKIFPSQMHLKNVKKNFNAQFLLFFAEINSISPALKTKKFFGPKSSKIFVKPLFYNFSQE